MTGAVDVLSTVTTGAINVLPTVTGAVDMLLEEVVGMMADTVVGPWHTNRLHTILLANPPTAWHLTLNLRVRPPQPDLEQCCIERLYLGPLISPGPLGESRISEAGGAEHKSRKDARRLKDKGSWHSAELQTTPLL